MTSRRLRALTRDLLPYPGRVLGVAGAALLLTLPALDANRYEGWRADLRTMTLASVVVASVGALLLAARYAARPAAAPPRFPVRLAVALVGAALLAAAYLAAAQLLFRLVVPVEVESPLRGLPVRGLVLAVLAAAVGVAVGALWRRPVALVTLGVLLVGVELAVPSGIGPLSAVRFWLLGVGQPHDVPGCVSPFPSECVTWTYRHWPSGLALVGTALVAVLVATVLASRAPADDIGPLADTRRPEGPRPRAAPGRTRYALAAALVVAGFVLTPTLVGTGARHATSDVATGIGSGAPIGSPAEVPVALPGRLAVFAVGLVEVRDCHARSADGTRVGLSPVLGTVRYGDGVSYRWIGNLRLPAPGRWTVTCVGEQGEYLVAGPPRVEGLVGRLVEAPRPVGWLLGVLPGLLVAAHAAYAGRRHGQPGPPRPTAGRGADQGG
ncbi:hypothetical protein [Micromonospora sp. WMMD812]|uniref:hypothetical protein n=1 Tax=Micromonospora sp. WMMD812 TaxID=3015152 RepID=UPI00248C6FD0|nr:hypothetical protein [Micromonospora sp. WMMD812]WBB67227.1 hypothetical protein O7603_29695 [Micromonospora sp. WMMD812]